MFWKQDRKYPKQSEQKYSNKTANLSHTDLGFSLFYPILIKTAIQHQNNFGYKTKRTLVS